MKSIIVNPTHNFEEVERDKPVAGSGRMILKPNYVAICGSDNMLWNMAPGMALGHEFSGWVEDPGEFNFKKGQRVCAAEFNSCGECEFCRSGREQLCKNMMVDNPGVTMDGAHGEFISVRGDYVLPLPDEVPMELGAIVEPVAVSLHGVKYCNFSKGESILVWGNGPIGIYAAAAAKLLGAGKVYMVGRGMGRVDFCNQQFDFVDECFSTKDEDFDARLRAVMPEEGFASIIDCVGVAYYDELAAYAKSGATIVLLGMHAAQATFTPMTLFYKELSIRTGLYFSWEDYKQAFDMVCANVELFEKTITNRIEWTADALQAMHVKLFESGSNDECKVLVVHDEE